MKKLQPLFLLFLFADFLIGQNADLEYIFSEAAFTHLPLMVDRGEKIYLAGSDQSCYDGLVIGMENQEIIFAAYPEEPGGFWQVSDFEWSEATDMLIGCSYWREADDYHAPTDGLLVFGINESGQVLFKNKLSIEDYPEEISATFLVPKISQTINSDFMVSYDRNLLKFNAEGNLINSWLLFAGTTLQEIEYVNDSTLLVYDLTDYYFLNQEGQLLNTIDGNSLINDVYIDDENIYALTETHLFVYSTATGTSTVITSFFDNIEDPKGITGNDTHLFLFQKEVPNAKYIQLDKNSFEVQSEQHFEQPNTGLYNILAGTDSLYLLGREGLKIIPGSGNWLPGQAFIKAVPIAEPPSFENYDIEITALEVDSLELVSIYHDDPLIYYTFSKPQMTMQITNKGDHPIHSFAFASRQYDGFNCDEFRIFQYVDSILILPGETYTHFAIANGYKNWEVNSFNLPDLEFCLFAPGHRFDQDISNNCVSVPIVTIVATHEPDWATSLQLSPNPASEEFQLSLVFKNAPQDVQLSVFDVMGKQYDYKKTEAAAVLKTQLNVSEYPAGIYFVQITADGESVTRRVVVE